MNLDVMEVVVLDHITAILYVGWQSASEDLTKEEAQACIDHFNPYIEWRDVAILGFDTGFDGIYLLWLA